jgi:hypothetical protein
MKDFHSWVADMAGTIEDASTFKREEVEPQSEAVPSTEEDIWNYIAYTYKLDDFLMNILKDTYQEATEALEYCRAYSTECL